MKKVLILLTVIASLCFPVSAYADAEPCYLEFKKQDGIENIGIAAGFDEHNVLTAAAKCDVIIGDNICSAEFEMKNTGKIKSVRIYFPQSQTAVKDFITYEIPTETLSQLPPSDTESNTQNNTDTNTVVSDTGITEEENTAISRYPTELDAATAFMMVKSVDTVAENDEIKTRLTVLFRGEETEITVPEDITLSNAPLINYSLIGESASALSPGDVIYCSTNMSGKLRTVELIFRPQSEDIISQDTNYGNNFELLFSTGNTVTTANPTPVAVYGGDTYDRQYAFGVIREKKSGYMELGNKSGIADKNISVGITEDTVVYVYNNTRRNNKASIGTTGDIEKTWIDTAFLDDDFNVTQWDTEPKTYALVRMSDGIALDVAVFYN